MKQGRKLYVIPGLGETARTKNYREIIRFAKERGFKVVPVKLEWDLDEPFATFVKAAEEQIPADVAEDYVLGFSFGAYIAALLAPKRKAKGYFFCSMSPYFKDDLKHIPQDTKDYFGKTFMSSFRRYSFPKNGTGKAWFFLGDKDWEIARERMEKSFEEWKGEKEMRLIKGAGHELKHPNYVKAVTGIFRKL